MSAKSNLARRVAAESERADKKGRGRRPGKVEPVVRYLRQTGNPNLMVAEMARMIINRHRPREKVYERNLLKRAIDAGDWATVDAVTMVDTIDKLLPNESKRIAHKEAIKQALKEFKRLSPDGISKSEVRFGILGGHRMAVLEPSPPDAPRRQPDYKSVEKILWNLKDRE